MNPTIFELAIREYSPSLSGFIPAETRPQRLILDSYMGLYELCFTEPMFASVTHLTLLQGGSYLTENWERWSGITALPALTHLCLAVNISRLILPQLLAECPRLRAVVTAWLPCVPSRAQVDAFLYVLTTPDPRVVVIGMAGFYDSWEKGGWTGNDLWVRADDFIARKRCGEIEGRSFSSVGLAILIRLS